MTKHSIFWTEVAAKDSLRILNIVRHEETFESYLELKKLVGNKLVDVNHQIKYKSLYLCEMV